MSRCRCDLCLSDVLWQFEDFLGDEHPTHNCNTADPVVCERCNAISNFKSNFPELAHYKIGESE